MEIQRRKTLYISVGLAALFLVFASLGSGVETVQGKRIVFEGITQSGAVTGISRICSASALDVMSLLAITMLSHPAASLAVTSMTCAHRGAVLGASAQLLAANSASVAGVIYSVVYVMVALLVCSYGVLINRNKLSKLTLLCLYGTVTGTVVILRGVSMLIT